MQNSTKYFLMFTKGILGIVSFFLLLSSCQTTSTAVSAKSEHPIIEFYDSIPPINTSSSEYHVFPATKDGKLGWMNVLGDWVVPPIYDSLGNYFLWEYGMLVLKKDEKFGVINYNNEVIIPFEYDFAPSINPNGVITIDRRNEDGYLETAYFSKKGKLTRDFGRSIEFRNGFAVTTSNEKRIGSYPRHNSEYWSEIFTSDFALINTNFDTLLHVKNTPFLLEIGSLNDNRRSFILHPYLGRHADRGIEYGIYGYLDGNGEIAVEPKFNPKFALNQRRNGYDWNPDFPFVKNRALVEKADNSYCFIDINGKEIIVLDSATIEGDISSVSHFNEFGIAAVSSFQKDSRQSKIHLIDTMGRIVFQSNENDAYIGMMGVIERRTSNRMIVISDQKNGRFEFYSPGFKHIQSFPKQDSLYNYLYSYENNGQYQEGSFFLLQQGRTLRSKHVPPIFPLSEEIRIISSENNPITSWIPSQSSILSHQFGVLSHKDTSTHATTLYDFAMNILFTDTTCNLLTHETSLMRYGIYRLYCPDRKETITINYLGTILSELCTNMKNGSTIDGKIVDLSPQLDLYNHSSNERIKLTQKQLDSLFKNSEMYSRIIKYY